VVPPAKFISLAEEFGIINALGTWCLDEACRQLAQWASDDSPGAGGAHNARAQNARVHNGGQRVGPPTRGTPPFVGLVAAALSTNHISRRPAVPGDHRDGDDRGVRRALP